MAAPHALEKIDFSNLATFEDDFEVFNCSFM